MNEAATVKLCECGCGQPTPVATQTNRRFGHVKGEALRFVRFHRLRVHTWLPSPADTFWRNVRKVDGDACWEWIGHRDPRGYGRVSTRAFKTGLAHRVAYRPDHLFTGSDADNIHDAIAKGRFVPPPVLSGEENFAARLLESQVREIRIRYASGDRQINLATEFGVSQTTISDIICRHIWKHVA